MSTVPKHPFAPAGDALGPSAPPPKFDLEIKPSLLARNTILNMIGLGLPMVIGVLAMPVTIKLLGTERFGILSLVWVAVGYLAFFDLGLGRATTKFIAEAIGKRETEKISRILWTTAFFQLILGLAGAALLAFATPLLVTRILRIDPRFIAEARVSFILIGASLPVVLASASFRGALEARQRFDLVNIVKGTSSTLNYLLPLAGVAAGFDLRGIVGLLVGTRALILVCWIALCLKTYPGLGRGIAVRGENVPALLKFGGWVTVSNVVQPVLNYLDRFLIGSLVNMRAVGYYVAPFEIITKAGILPGSLVLTLFPSFSHFQGRAEPGRAKTLFGYAVKYLIISIGPISVLLVFLARPILRLWLGADFAARSAAVFQIMAAGFLVTALADVGLAYIQGMGRPDLAAKVHTVELVLFVPVAWLLIRAWGITGAAAAWGLRVLFDLAALYTLAWRVGDLRFTRRELLERGIPQGILALGLLAMGGWLVAALHVTPYSIAVLLAGFLVLCGVFVLTRQEIVWLRTGAAHILAGLQRRRQGA